MKLNYIKFVLSVLLCATSINVSAYKFEVDGIYYNILDEDLTVAVTYKSNSYNSYSGHVAIPETVEYNEKTYQVTNVGENAFYNCKGLTSVSIPSSMKSMNHYAFYGCNGLEKVITEDLAKWCEISFEEEYSNPLRYAHHLYSDEDTEITDLVIPNGVTKIGNYVFCGLNISPNSLIIPNSVTSIGDGAFSNWSLKSLTIGTGVLSIGKNAFSDKPVKTIWLTNTPPDGYNYAAGKINYVANNSYSSLYDQKTYPFLSSLFEVDGVKYVPVSPSERTCDALECTYDSTQTSINIDSIVAYRGVTMKVMNIQPFACYQNTFMKEATLNIAGDISRYAFYSCSSLEAVTFGNHITAIDICAFSNCTTLKGIVITDAVKTIGQSAFSDCENMQYVTMGDSLSNIGESSFANCKFLETVDMNDNLKVIGKYAFTGCKSLVNVKFPGSLTSIGDYSFAYCSKIANVVMNDRDSSHKEESLRLGSNGNRPLFSDSPLDSVYIGRDISYETDVNYGYSPFYNNKSLRSVVITDEETEITPREFYGCTNLRNVSIGDNVSVIGDYAFSNCSSLQYINTGKGVQAIGGNAYSGCTSLAGIHLGEKLITVGNQAFSGCNSLLGIILPGALSYIGSYAFKDCSKVSTVIMADRNSLLNDTINFGEWRSTETFSKTFSFAVTSGCVLSFDYDFEGISWRDQLAITINGDSHQFNSGKNTYRKTFPNAETVTFSISFSKYSSTAYAEIKNIKVSGYSAVLNLGSNGSSPLFSDCPLDSVYIGRNITYNTNSTYGYSPFYRNTTLRSVVITDKETEISPNEFYGCTSLRNVSIGDSVAVISDYAFSGCSSLEYFSFGSSVETIGKEAFSDCTNMSRLISKAETPPSCGTQALDDINKWNCTLSVPKGFSSVYQQADQWKEFFFIEEIEYQKKLKGDVNGDGTVDVADIATVISVMAGSVENHSNTADVNGDGTVDVADIATIISEMAARARMEK